MTVVDNPGDSDVYRLITTIQELSAQLADSRAVAHSLHSAAGAAKTQATHSQSGFVLRRFNLDKTKEVYDAELEPMNASLAAENQTLQHDNKQLGVLIREYEQSLERIVSAFRTRARDVQEHELALIRYYESKLLAKESENLLRTLTTSTAESASLGRISDALRNMMRMLDGEDSPPATVSSSPDITHNTNVEQFEFDAGSMKDSSLQQDVELARLEQENAVLRRMLGLELRESEYGRDAFGSMGTSNQQ
ncbi:hypothetical protein SCLCIDRAFT_846263 [Scleroderma citrinum Foug A]|uniref:Uncharacterized protein n=1 Tax=Scleroderma citrinum Foug A TaxID=1036808 RepID=A0A0C3E0U1_9AGAM|nr:hypothetical protein SCLCIDRAFT_846263 [Scleroderma citrinum Foug A]